MRRIVLAGALAVAGMPVAAEVPAAADGAVALSRTYVCEGGAVVQVAYLNLADGESFAVVGWGGVLVPMQAGISGSGVRYVDFDAARGLVWHTKGAEGLLAHDTGADQATILSLCIEAGG